VIAQLALLGALGVPVGAASGAPLDSQLVLQRYGLALDALAAPKAVIFTYTVSQAGPASIEQRHRIYRSGDEVRDEVLVVDGVALKTKITRISIRQDHYALARVAPRENTYGFIFVRSERHGGRIDYIYDALPYFRATTGFIVKHLTIDGKTFLPRAIAFETSTTTARGEGELVYAPIGQYWMPVLASVSADLAGKPARERIVWSEYRFPASLPASTFISPKPLPHVTHPA
jgi:hypothetical protein